MGDAASVAEARLRISEQVEKIVGFSVDHRSESVDGRFREVRRSRVNFAYRKNFIVASSGRRDAIFKGCRRSTG